MEATVSVAGSILNPEVMALMCLGTVVGIISGTTPGLNTPTTVALLLSSSFVLDTVPAIPLLTAVHIGGISDGLVSVILFRTPGIMAAIVIAFDGYPMYQKGQTAEVLVIGTSGSPIGGLFDALALWLIAPSLIRAIIKFGPRGHLGVASLSLCLVNALMGNNVVKGLISMLIDLLLSAVGINSTDGIVKRFTFNFYQLKAGLSMVIVIVGIYAVLEILVAAERLKEDMISVNFEKKISYFLSKKNIPGYWPYILRSSMIGTSTGVLPGMGSSTRSMPPCAAVKKLPKHPEEFGQGTPEGVYVAEVSNNTMTSGALVPMLSLGVPGDSITAITIAALVMQGISVDPILFTTNKGLIHALILAIFVTSILMFVFQSFGIPIFVRIAQVPRYYLMPLIAMRCVIGCVGINNRMFDVYVIIVLGILGYALEKNHYPPPPFLLGFTLGSMVEQYYHRSLIYYGNFRGCMGQWSADSLLVIAVVPIPVVSLMMKHISLRKTGTGQ